MIVLILIYAKSVYSVVDDIDDIFIFSMDAIFNKCCDFNFYNRLGYSIKRYYKYTQRGFNINKGNLDNLYSRINRCS